MDISNVSSALNAVNTASIGSLTQTVSIKMLDQTMEMSEAMNSQLVSLMEQSVTPHLGGNIDVLV